MELPNMVDVVTENHKGAIDKPDSRDFVAEHILGAEPVALPPSVNIDYVPSHDQGTTGECTAFGLNHCSEIQNTILYYLNLKLSGKVKTDPEEQWKNQMDVYHYPVSHWGDSLQNALDTLVKSGLTNKNNPDLGFPKFTITGYATISKTVESFKTWLAKGHPIYTGWQNHCFCIVGYDDAKGYFIAKNSYAAAPQFVVFYNQIDLLFTSYILYIQPKLNMIFKDVSENSPMAAQIKRMRDLGLVKGYGDSENPEERFFKPDQTITRAETAVMLSNVLDLVEKKLNIKF